MVKSSNEIEKRIVKSFLDIVIMSILKEIGNLNGHEIWLCIYKKLGILLNQGSIYSALHALERAHLIREVEDSRYRTYKLTSNGLAKLREVDKIQKAFNLLIAQLCDRVEQTPPIQH